MPIVNQKRSSTFIQRTLRNRYGETAIMLASYDGLYNIVEKFYVKGAEIRCDGWNPLLYAAATNGYVRIKMKKTGISGR